MPAIDRSLFACRYDVEHGRQAIGYFPQDKSVVAEEDLPWNTKPKL